MISMQQQVADFVAQHGLEAPLPHRLLDLLSELGELSKEALKATDYGKHPLPSGAITPQWEAELGDVLFALICIANATNVTLEDALTSTLKKYQQRIETANSAGSGS